MKEYRIAERRQAIVRGLESIYRIACDEEVFNDYGHDLLICFQTIAATSEDEKLRRMSRQMGRERALAWRKMCPTLPDEPDGDNIPHLVFGSNAADRLGVRDPLLKAALRRAAPRLTGRDYFWFDAATEPPPGDVPDACKCGEVNPRGTTRCITCRKRLVMQSRYGVWCVALTRTYTGDRYGVKVGSRFADVIKWLPQMRPYQPREPDNRDFSDAIYAVTHVVYTLNDYGHYKLAPEWLPHEFEFLRTSQKEAIALNDADMMGEFLDALQSFGMDDRDPAIREGIDFLLAAQNPDGTWGGVNDEDYYRYHATWTAVDGLREHRWRGVGLSFPKLRPMLERFAQDSKPTHNARSKAG
jgi:hypothetical protein